MFINERASNSKKVFKNDEEIVKYILGPQFEQQTDKTEVPHALEVKRKQEEIKNAENVNEMLNSELKNYFCNGFSVFFDQQF